MYSQIHISTSFICSVTSRERGHELDGRMYKLDELYCHAIHNFKCMWMLCV